MLALDRGLEHADAHLLLDLRGGDQDLLDVELTQDDRDAFIEYLVSVGLLSNDDLSYGPNTARGWSALDGGGPFQDVPTAPYAEVVEPLLK